MGLQVLENEWGYSHQLSRKRCRSVLGSQLVYSLEPPTKFFSTRKSTKSDWHFSVQATMWSMCKHACVGRNMYIGHGTRQNLALVSHTYKLDPGSPGCWTFSLPSCPFAPVSRWKVLQEHYWLELIIPQSSQAEPLDWSMHIFIDFQWGWKQNSFKIASVSES